MGKNEQTNRQKTKTNQTKINKKEKHQVQEQ
jgi:hypothetical protein